VSVSETSSVYTRYMAAQIAPGLIMVLTLAARAVLYTTWVEELGHKSRRDRVSAYPANVSSLIRRLI
jgi:hypothetical protein